MAEYNIKVPIASFEANYNWAKEFGNIPKGLQKIKLDKRVYSAIKECSKNSNVPEELMISMILALSNGNNNSSYKSADMQNRVMKPLVRMGYFALSNLTARICLYNEIQQGRINSAERDYLNKYGNVNVQKYITDTPLNADKSINKWWRVATGVNIQQISDSTSLKIAPFNLETPELNICIGAIILGQCWDYYSKYYSNPLVPVVVSMLLPYDYYLHSSSILYPFNTEILRPPLNAIKDWDKMLAIEKLPRPNIKSTFNASITGNVINPFGNWIGIYVPLVAGKGGALETLVNKNV